MLTNNDCILLLNELSDKGIDVGDMKRKVYSSLTINPEVVKFINVNRTLDIVNFYEHLRKQYNGKHSKVYINIVKDNINPNDALVTLTSLLTQIMLYAQKLDNSDLFLKHSRADDITKVISQYLKDYNLINVTNLISLIRADLKAFESLHR